MGKRGEFMLIVTTDNVAGRVIVEALGIVKGEH